MAAFLAIFKPKNKAQQRYLKIFWGLFLFPFVFIAFMLIVSLFSTLPTFEQLENPKSNQATEILSGDGKVIGQYFRENRVNISFKEISPNVINALIATEDERFYSHSGIDIKALFRVVKGAITANSSQGGGSTITQQLAKMLFSEKPESRWERVRQKFKEWIISVRLERRYTKEEILTMYLNRFDFVNNAVGIKSAAAVYFNTTPDKLTLEQSAMLVGMAKNPSYFNPVGKRAQATLERRNVVLKQMLKNGYISEEDFEKHKAKDLNLDFHRVDHNEGLAPYFREVLRGEVSKLLFEKDNIGDYKLLNPETNQPYDIYKDGLKIITSIDSRMQNYAEWAVIEHMSGFNQPEFFKDLKNKKNAPFDYRVSKEEIAKLLDLAIKRSDRYIDALDAFENQKGEKPSDAEIARFKRVDIPRMFNKAVKMKVFTYDGERDTVMSPLDSIKYYKSYLQTGFCAIEPQSGHVKAWVGGINYKHFKYDHVTQGTYQVGSTFKPFVYAAAVREGLNPCERVPNEMVCFDMPNGEPTWCPKNSDGKYGGVVTMKEGLAKSMNNITAFVMKRYGPEPVIKLVKDLGITADLQPVPSLCLGVANINLMEMVAAYAAFANKGVYVKPVFIVRIEDKNGKVIYNSIPETKEALDENTAYVMLDMMKGVTTFGTGARIRRATPYGNIPYPVAGKTGTTQSNSDGWFVGITPDLVAGAWVGGEDRAIRFSRTQYGQGASSALPIWGYFMNKVYKDSTIRISKKDFPWPKRLNIDLNCTEVNKEIDFEEEQTFDE